MTKLTKEEAEQLFKKRYEILEEERKLLYCKIKHTEQTYSYLNLIDSLILFCMLNYIYFPKKYFIWSIASEFFIKIWFLHVITLFLYALYITI